MVRTNVHPVLRSTISPFPFLNICFMFDVFLSKVWTCFRFLSSNLLSWEERDVAWSGSTILREAQQIRNLFDSSRCIESLAIESQYLAFSSKATRGDFLWRTSCFPHQIEWRRRCTFFVKGARKRLKRGNIAKFLLYIFAVEGIFLQ